MKDEECRTKMDMIMMNKNDKEEWRTRKWNDDFRAKIILEKLD